jgi:hypothetical protein
MSIKGKDESLPGLPSCPRCGATMDLKRLESFGSRHIINGELYYCNNPICPPEEWEQKQRLLLDRLGIAAM